MEMTGARVRRLFRVFALCGRSLAMNKSYLLALFALTSALAGCQPMRPPSPAAQKLIKEQTAIGPVNTKVQAKPFTYPVKTGELSLWDIKVFSIKDKDNGLRQEWKHFAQLPQQLDATITNTQVLMNGWIISRDGTVFLPQKPTYKAYGSFYTDWTLPRAGDYTLWLEYVPAVAHEEELSAQELINRKASYNLPREVAYWDFKAVGAALPTPSYSEVLSPSPPKGRVAVSVYNDKGGRMGEVVHCAAPLARIGQKADLQWAVANQKPVENPEIIAIAPDGSTLLHGIGAAPSLTFDKAGEWKIWFNYTREGRSFAAPYVLKVLP